MKKSLLAAGIILAACLPSVTSAASITIMPPSPNGYYQINSSYTNISLGMADRERKEQEAWEREKKRRGKEYESDKQEQRERERWERQEEKQREKEDRRQPEKYKHKNKGDLKQPRRWGSTSSQSGGEGD